jgi:hypothetical protein
MSETSDHNFLLTLRLRSMRSDLRALSDQIATHDRLLYHVILPALIRPGPQPSPAQSPSPTTGTPWFTTRDGLMQRVKALGEWARLASMMVGLVKGAIWLLGIIIPSLLLAAAAVWKLLVPHLSRLVLGL